MQRYDPKWVSEHYDAYGDREWHRWEESHANEVEFHVHRHYLEQYIKESDYVLEVGAGAGRFTQVLAELGARILVADISPVQLELNRQHAGESGFEHAVQDRLLIDMCDMGVLEDETFDAVVCYGGPLSYAFDRRNLALREMLRVLKPSGRALFSVMTLWGAVHEFLPGVLTLAPEENWEIIWTGDLHPDTFKQCTHRCHMFRAEELRAVLEESGTTVLLMSASNCLSAVWGDRLAEVREDPPRWQELLRLEVEACREPGCVDMGTHLIAVVRRGLSAGGEEDDRQG